jgi:hypothetical protein
MGHNHYLLHVAHGIGQFCGWVWNWQHLVDHCKSMAVDMMTESLVMEKKSAAPDSSNTHAHRVGWNAEAEGRSPVRNWQRTGGTGECGMSGFLFHVVRLHPDAAAGSCYGSSPAPAAVLVIGSISKT